MVKDRLFFKITMLTSFRIDIFADEQKEAELCREIKKIEYC